MNVIMKLDKESIEDCRPCSIIDVVYYSCTPYVVCRHIRAQTADSRVSCHEIPHDRDRLQVASATASPSSILQAATRDRSVQVHALRQRHTRTWRLGLRRGAGKLPESQRQCSCGAPAAHCRQYLSLSRTELHFCSAARLGTRRAVALARNRRCRNNNHENPK